MNNELVIDITPSEMSMALIEEKRLVELHKEKSNKQFSVGDIYLAKVKKIMGGLNAAFVDVGYSRDAFLHYLDLGAQYKSQQHFLLQALDKTLPAPNLSKFKLTDDLDKKGKISDVVNGGQVILVQIAKEPISTKGPRLSSEISIAGRNLVLIPFSNKVSVSQKIRSREEKKRLKSLILSIRPKNFGVIIRTVAKDRRAAVLDEELTSLVKKWESVFSKIRQAKPPELLMGELNRPVALLRDIMNSSFNKIHINDPKVFTQIESYVSQIAPEKTNILKLYSGDKPIFEHFGIIRQLKASFGKTITVKNGAYIIIEHTEALHVIDVNSGNRMRKSNDQEANALEVNISSGIEIARQLRLRDMGGIIVIDFIDMRAAESRKKLYAVMKEEMAKDRTKHSILPLSKIGLMQITRQRVRPVTNIITAEGCPSCKGTGEVTASVLFIDEIENHLDYLIEKKCRNMTLLVHPYIAGFITSGLKSKRLEWFLKHKQWIKIKPEVSYGFLQYNFINKEGKRIKL